MTLKADKFPHLSNSLRAKWAPVLLAPILGSPERLVIAVIAAVGGKFHIEPANALGKLECLFGTDANTPAFVAEAAVQEIRAALSRPGTDLSNIELPFSSISLGEIYEGEAENLQDMAKSWMSTISSLYKSDLERQYPVAAVLYDAGVGVGPDRLPNLVYDHVLKERPGLRDFFNPAIRENKQRRTKAHGVDIDYSGSRIVANFSTLASATRAQSVDRIKRKIFDLIVDRDSETGGMVERAHDMFVYHPARDDPTVTEKQYENILEVLDELGGQSQKEQIGFHGVSAVSKIAERIVEKEGRAGIN